MIIQEIPCVMLQYDAAARFVRASWRPDAPLERFTGALEQIMEFSRQRGVEQWLMNIDWLPPLGPSEQEWILAGWFPAMAHTAVRHLALVLPLDLHNQMVAVTPMHLPGLAMSFELHFFADDASAFAWLLDQAPNRETLWQEWEQTQLRVVGRAG